MNIQGIGIVFNRGLGAARLEEALNDGWKAPREPAYLVDLDTIPDKAILKKVRRADKLSKMAVLAAADAVSDSGMCGLEGRKTGVIVATAFGAHVTTFGFLDNILDYGDKGVSPTLFSNSLHNAAASYIASALDACGPTLTVTRLHLSFHYALELAMIWLNEGRCDHVLVGATDQYGDVMGWIYRNRLTPAPDGRIKPFEFNPTHCVPGEGAVFFLLGKEKTGRSYCAIEEVRFDKAAEAPCHHASGLTIIDADGSMPDESIYLSSFDPHTPVAAYSPLFGSTMASSAFNCAAGALMLKKGVCFASPVPESRHPITVLTSSPVNLGLIRCVRYNCLGEKATVTLFNDHNPF
jgi:3-oxoacyl-[acyl-carrier-protein] synthase II